MADENFRPRRPHQEQPHQEGMYESHSHQTEEDELNKLNVSERIKQSSHEDTNIRPLEGLNIKGNIPPEFLQAIRAEKSQGVMPEPKSGFGQNPSPQPQNRSSGNSSNHLKELLEELKGTNSVYEEIELPSKGRFYDGSNGPSNGIISIRTMTGEEEQILATSRLVKKGQAMDMIFQKCIKEKFRTDQLLSIDRIYLLIYLRGISYGSNYDVEIKCPECERKFSTSIDLNALYVDSCPDEFGPSLQDVLPTTKLPFSYRLSTGRDEQEISNYRERKIKMFGDSATDDTLTYRTAMLLNNIDGIENKNELQILIKNLPMSDVSYIRNCINEPPFGVNTSVEIICPSCLQDFEIDLPIESNFFSPRRKKDKTQA